MKRKHKWESKKAYLSFLKNNFNISYSFFRGRSILEVGCGLSGLIFYIEEKSLYSIGIDPLIISYIQNNQLSKRTINSSALSLVNAVGEAIPFKDNLFDIVICGNVIDHSLNPNLLLGEISRVLKHKGFLILYLNIFRLPKFLRKGLFWIDQAHPHHFCEKEVIDLLKENNLKIIFFRRKRDVLASGLKKKLAPLIGVQVIYLIASKK